MLRGETGPVVLQIVNGGWADIDFAGGYWHTDASVPQDLTSSDLDSAVGTLRRANRVVVTVAGAEFMFEGPLACF